MYSEDDFILISALQHYIYCPRQCGLIHVDEIWQENLFTIRGNILHNKVHSDSFESRSDKKIVRGLRIHSFKYGLVGKCDVVEFSKVKNILSVRPVEFKAGKPKDDISDKVQLCAQVLCLEEMLSTNITKADFFYGKIKRRYTVEINNTLRNETCYIINSVRNLIDGNKVPVIEYSSKCHNCSIQKICQPKAMNKKNLRLYINNLYKE